MVLSTRAHLVVAVCSGFEMVKIVTIAILTNGLKLDGDASAQLLRRSLIIRLVQILYQILDRFRIVIWQIDHTLLGLL